MKKKKLWIALLVAFVVLASAAIYLNRAVIFQRGNPIPYGIPPHGVARAQFSCCSSSGKAGFREYRNAPPELLRRGFAFDHINCHKQAWDTWKTQVTRCYLSVKAQHQLDFFDRLNSVPIRVLSYCKCVEKSLP